MLDVERRIKIQIKERERDTERAKKRERERYRGRQTERNKDYWDRWRYSFLSRFVINIII